MKRMNCTIKRIWFFFIAFIIAIALCACANNMSGSQSGQNSASENTDILLEFKSFLDGEGFVGGVSQSKFIDEIVPQYTYEGKTIPEIIAGCNWDSENGGGWFAEDGRFGVSNFNESGVYMNRLYTTLPLHGLSLPFDIRFGDSVKKVINKMGVEFDPSDFTPDADSKTDITLISGNGMLVRYGDAGKNNAGDYPAPYWITFIEKTTDNQDNGQEKSIERQIDFWFDDSGLMRFQMDVVERRQ